MVVEGQIQGAVALGIGSVLLEEIVYDEAGQLQAGTTWTISRPPPPMCRA